MFHLPSPKYRAPPPSSFKLQVLLIHPKEETKKLINLEQISKRALSGLETSDSTSQGAAIYTNWHKTLQGKVRDRGYLVSKRLMNVCGQLSPPPLSLQLHGTGRRAWPDAATSVCKTHPRRGHGRHPPHDPPRPLPEGCDLRPPWVAVPLHPPRPKASTDANQFPDAAHKAPVRRSGLTLRTAGLGAGQRGPTWARVPKARPRLRAREAGGGGPAEGSPRPGFEFSRRPRGAERLTPVADPLRRTPPADKPTDESPPGSGSRLQAPGRSFLPGGLPAVPPGPAHTQAAASSSGAAQGIARPQKGEQKAGPGGSGVPRPAQACRSPRRPPLPGTAALTAPAPPACLGRRPRS